MRIPMPATLAERAAAARDGDVVPTRDAATIALVRPGTTSPQTYLLRRQTTMAFAPGQLVFPGGTVQDSDHDDVPWVGRPETWWGQRFGCEPTTARALVVAAVRETFEESGILLAGAGPDDVVDDTTPDWAQQARLDLEAGRISLAELLAARDLVLRADLLGAWAHWITPAFEPRRYDTRFLVARVPAGQVVGSLPDEADQAAWMPLDTVLRTLDEGEVAMLPPTAITCRELAGVSVEDLLDVAERRTIVPIEPRLVEVDGELYLENPLGEEQT